jgi:glycosyltransferase involved in cell wall biosynthesis
MIKAAWLAPYPIGQLRLARFSRPLETFGTGTWLVNLANELKNHDDIDLHIICENAKLKADQDFCEDKIKFHLIKNSIPLINKGYPSKLPIPEISGYYLTIRKIVRLLKSINPDIVHAHGTENSYALAAVKSGFPNIISIQGVVSEIVKYDSSLRMRLKARLEASAIKQGGNFMLRTNLDNEIVQKLNNGANRFIVHECINPVFFNTEWEYQNSRNLLYVGSLHAYKGLGVLLDAVKIIKTTYNDINLTVIGNGNIDKYKKICLDNGISGNVKFLGYQIPEIVAELHQNSQVLVCPSFIENSPNVIAEAMVSGLPIIASHVGGIPSMITDNISGLLVDPGNSDALAKKISYLLHNSEVGRKLSYNAKRIAREKHLPLNVARETISIYKKIIGSNN